MPMRQMAASAPPATMTSASSHMIRRAASPSACAPVEQAVTTAWLGPLKPYLMETCPDARLISAEGMKNGPTLRGLSALRSEEHTSELQSLMRISYAVFCLKNKKLQNSAH